MGFSFVPITIASLMGVERADAGVASGLINTSRQIGGAIGLAAISAIAATQARDYLHAHPGVSATSGAALDHGLQIAFYTMFGLLLAGIAVTIVAVRPARPRPAAQPVPEIGEAAIEEAA